MIENTNVYNLICESIGVAPLANNGTIHLPFTTIGLHSDDDAPVLDTPEDPPKASVVPAPVNTPPATSAGPPPQETTPQETTPGSSEDGDEGEDTKSSLQSFYGGVKDTLSSFKDWLGQLFSSKVDNQPPSS
jgi:hypothetical protein